MIAHELQGLLLGRGLVLQLVFGETWAQRWLLMHLAKHLHDELEMRRLDSPAATAIEKIVFDEVDGSVTTWAVRPH